MGEKVTVIIIANDHPEWLAESIDSVLGQTYSDVEVLVIVPVSKGGLFEDLLKRYKDKLNCLFAESENPGVLMSSALENASGEFIAKLNEGDILSADNIKLRVEAFDPDTGMVATAYQVIGEDGNMQDTVYMPDFDGREVLSFLLYWHVFDKSNVMVRRECYQRAETYKESMAAEIDMLIRLARCCKIAKIKEPLAMCRIPSGDNQLREDIRRDTLRVIYDSVNSIPLEEIFPYLQGNPENDLARLGALCIVGVILMEQRLYASAKDSFGKARQLRRDILLPYLWLGILERRIGDHETSVKYLQRIPEGDKFYFDAQWAIHITSRIQDPSKGDQEKLRTELTDEYDSLLKLTLDLATGGIVDLDELPADIAEEVQSYLGWDASRILDAIYRGRELMREEWNTKNPQSESGILDFYKETENYIPDLAWWHRGFERKKLTRAAIEVCKQNDACKVLDFGCGIGQDGILLAESGFQVTLADLPGKTFEFAKWRVMRRGLDVKLISSDKLREKYDAILCFDVLEHLWEPGEVLEYLYKHLSDKGILLVTAHFQHTDTHPMHLERNARYLGDEFIGMMSQIGFSLDESVRMPLVFRVRSDR
jgi:2-polyprenyl-3-methyl-5-hydroxy-6-metoxy-1,4-benzoquinol methylase